MTQFKHAAAMIALCVSFALPSLVNAEEFPFDDPRWEFSESGTAIEEYKGRSALVMDRGGASLRDVTFRNGTIEYDLAFPPERTFAFIQFRTQDRLNREQFYLRSHQSGNPDANHYTPVHNGNATWQLFHTADFASPALYRHNEWMPIKLVISGTRMDVYIDNMEEPSLQVPRLMRGDEAGGVGLFAFGAGAARVANFRVTEMDNPPITEMNVPDPEPEPGTILSWQVSDAFMDDAEPPADPTWRDAVAEPSGILNLNPFANMREDGNTLLVRATVNSNTEMIRSLAFGYSDRATVYVNGVPVYSGDNSYRSRDYRYLGSIGYFDQIHVPLKAGENHITFRISEETGGWGVMAKWKD